MNRLKRWWHVRAMMRCIKSAQYDCISEKRSSKTDGLRVIASFERVNKIKFDPFKSSHRELIQGNGHWEGLFRSVRLWNELNVNKGRDDE